MVITPNGNISVSIQEGGYWLIYVSLKWLMKSSLVWFRSSSIRCIERLNLEGFEEFLLPYTYKNKNDPHIWASLRGLAGSRASKIQIIIDNTNFLSRKLRKTRIFMVTTPWLYSRNIVFFIKIAILPSINQIHLVGLFFLNSWYHFSSYTPCCIEIFPDLSSRLFQSDNRVYEIQFSVFIAQHIITGTGYIRYGKIFISIEISIFLWQIQLMDKIFINHFLRRNSEHTWYILLLQDNSDTFLILRNAYKMISCIGK